MIYFDFKGCLKQFYHSVFKAKNTNYRLSRRRIFFLIGYYLIFPFFEFLVRIGFILDNFFFPSYKKQEIKAPVFIIGNFRSGTTFLLHILARDKQNFAHFDMWEIYFAPSITQRKLIQAFIFYDSLIGSPITRLFKYFEKKVFGDIDIHKVRYDEPEEDEGLFLHIWSSLFTWFVFPIKGSEKDYIYFDEYMKPSEKKRIMDYYKNCIQRHLYAHGGNKIYLAKNPSSTPKIKTLLEYYPDARFIYLARNPLKMLPSELTLATVSMVGFNSPIEQDQIKQMVYEMTRHWYLYPLDTLRNLPENQKIILRFNELVSNPEQIIKKIYKVFNLKMSKYFSHYVHVTGEKSKNFKSKNTFSLSTFSITREEVLEKYKEVFDIFHFKPQSPEQKANNQDKLYLHQY